MRRLMGASLKNWKTIRVNYSSKKLTTRLKNALLKDNSWKSFISCNLPSTGKMHGLDKTHKINNAVTVITSDCNTAVEKLSTFLEKILC